MMQSGNTLSLVQVPHVNEEDSSEVSIADHTHAALAGFVAIGGIIGR